VADFLGAEYDAPPSRRVVRPFRSYVVCSTPRSGSGLLSRGLGGTGVLATPLEYFNPIHRGILTQRWGVSGLDSYLERLHARRTSQGGLFAAKVHWEQLVQLRVEAGAGPPDFSVADTSSSLLERAFPGAVFVRIVRRDLDRQAVSYWRAIQSGVWSIDGDSPDRGADAAPYSFDGIERCRQLIQMGEGCWDRLIREHGGRALVVTYEDLASDFASVVQRVAGFIQPGVDVVVPEPATRRQSDERSTEWLERFVAERRERS
jgi:LPS sulfotransferase NodH